MILVIPFHIDYSRLFIIILIILIILILIIYSDDLNWFQLFPITHNHSKFC